jgi:hypothetical protein
MTHRFLVLPLDRGESDVILSDLHSPATSSKKSCHPSEIVSKFLGRPLTVDEEKTLAGANGLLVSLTPEQVAQFS